MYKSNEKNIESFCNNLTNNLNNKAFWFIDSKIQAIHEKTPKIFNWST